MNPLLIVSGALIAIGLLTSDKKPDSVQSPVAKDVPTPEPKPETSSDTLDDETGQKVDKDGCGERDSDNPV